MNNLLDIIGEGIIQQKSHIVLCQGTTTDDVRKAIRIFMRKHPEVFWFSHQYRYDETTSILYLKYNFTPSKKDFFAKEIGNAVHFLFQPDSLKGLSDLEKVTYVYKWIAKNTTYNERSSFNQTIYSVLINRNSVCTGYAKTAQYLLGIIDVESELVFGKFNIDKTEGGRHGWNIVKIDEEWYHVDFCLADLSLKHLLNVDEDPIEHDGLLWNYFCKPTAYIIKNRSIEFVETYPECVKTIDKRPDMRLNSPLEQLAVCKSNSGSSAIIYLDSFNKNQVIKIARNYESLFANEDELLTKLKGSKHIINSNGLCESVQILEQLTPWTELLLSHYYQPTEKHLLDILIQLTEGLIECRDKGITYSDIHYNNVLVTKEGVFKWCDFGIAYPTMSGGAIPLNLIGHDGIPFGSRWFMAPETYKYIIFTQGSAIYSLSMLAYFVMNDMRPPFLSNSQTEQEALNKRLSGARIPLPKNAASYPRLAEIICTILNSDISCRPNTFERFKSKIFENEISYYEISPGKHVGYIPFPQQDDINLHIEDISDIEPDFKDEKTGDYYKDDYNENNPDYANKPSESDSYGYDEPNQAEFDEFANTLGGYKNRNNPNLELTRDYDLFARTTGIGLTPPPRLPDSKSNAPLPSNGSLPVSSYSSMGRRKVFFSRNPRLPLNEPITYFPSQNCLEDQTQPFESNQKDINACVYAPAEVKPKKSFIIRVYMYLPNEQKKVESKIKKIDPSAVKKDYKPLDLPIKVGDRITVELELSEGVQCKNSTKTVIWKNRYTDCSFMAKLTDPNQENIEGTVNVYINDLPVGEMLFTIDVVDSRPQKAYTKIDSRRFSKIFISYAHQDENQVRGIAEGCRMLGTEYFFDRHTLQAGDLFKERILSFINEADLFVLCWSKNAAESEWVRIEREHALRLIREGKSSLSIYPLSLRPEAPLPLDMSDKYNFGKL